MPLRDMDREQMWMLPPTLDELLPLDPSGAIRGRGSLTRWVGMDGRSLAWR